MPSASCPEDVRQKMGSAAVCGQGKSQWKLGEDVSNVFLKREKPFPGKCQRDARREDETEADSLI